MSDTDTQSREPSRARALLSTADMKLLRRALESHARGTEDRDELAKKNARDADHNKCAKSNIGN